MKIDQEQKIRHSLCRYGRRLGRHGLVAGAGGNISARLGNRIWITASGAMLEDLTPEQLVEVELRSGRGHEGAYHPSIELATHLAAYRYRDDVQAVFHIHAPFSTALATAGVDFSAVTFESVLELGEMETLPVLLPGSAELVERVSRAVQGHDVILLAHHGAVVLGRSVAQAYCRSAVLEEAAKIYTFSRLLNPGAGVLTPEIVRQWRREYAQTYRSQIP